MAEVMIIHASTPKRIEEFNKIASKLRIPIEGDIRKGYSIIFPYKAEPWFYKMKEEAVPQFLEFVKGNSSEIGCGGAGMRPVQGLLNMSTGLMSLIINIKAFITSIRRYRSNKKDVHGKTKNTFRRVDMSKVISSPKFVEGWGHSKVVGIFPDPVNHLGEEEL